MIVMSSAVEGLLILILVAVIYFAPSLIAANRKVPNVGSVFVINLFLGWTLVGWVVALAMAARSVPQEPGTAPKERKSFRLD